MRAVEEDGEGKGREGDAGEEHTQRSDVEDDVRHSEVEEDEDINDNKDSDIEDDQEEAFRSWTGSSDSGAGAGDDDS